jgi:NADPH-dependent 2,4-dienoyl-CoA reductase/sulfur reductase-like enzyme
MVSKDHLIGSPLAFASEPFSKKAWVKYDDIPALRAKNITHLQGSATHVDCEKKVATIVDGVSKREIRESYDYLVVATGLRRVFPTVPQSLTRKAYLFETEGHIEKVKNAKEGVVVIGGGN